MRPGDRFQCNYSDRYLPTVWEITAIDDKQVRYKVIADQHENFIGTRGHDTLRDLEDAIAHDVLTMVSVTTLDAILKNAYTQQGFASWLPSDAGTRAPDLTPSLPVAKSAGLNCAKCNELNEYAEPNQVDGSYRCFGCR